VEFVLAHVDDLERPCWCEGTRVRQGAAVSSLEAGGRKR